MVIQSENDRYASSKGVERSIAGVTKLYDLSYLLGRHVDKKYWMHELQKCFSVKHAENLTDFNYSRCFTYAINEGDLKLCVRDSEFKEHVVKYGELNRVHILISALAPYVFYKYVRYYCEDNAVHMESSKLPPVEWGQRINSGVLEFCRGNDLFIIPDDELRRTVNGISLELHGENPSVFNLLFEDGNTGFPY